MRFSFRFIPAVTIFLACFGCSRNDQDNPPLTGTGNGATQNGCPLSAESYTQPISVDPRWFIYYDADDNFNNATGYTANGIRNGSLIAGNVSLTFKTNEASGTYHFSSNYFTGQPSSYSLTTSDGTTEIRSVSYNPDSTISGLILTDSSGKPLADIAFDYSSGNLIRLNYQQKSGNQVSAIFYIDSYDGNPNAQHEMKGNKFLFFNWEYFSTPDIEMGRVFKHVSQNNWTHFYCKQNGVKTIEETISYDYNRQGYPVSGKVRVVTFSRQGAPLTDNIYTVTYAYFCE